MILHEFNMAIVLAGQGACGRADVMLEVCGLINDHPVLAVVFAGDHQDQR